MNIFDIFFPKHCVVCKKIGEYLCASCFAGLSFDVSRICLACNGFSIDGLTHPRCQTKYCIDGVFCGLTYKKGMKRLIYRFKYKPYLSDLGSFLTNLLNEGLIQQEMFMQILQEKKPVLIPIPLSSSKLKKRGYNQAKILADGLAQLYKGQVREYLERKKDTKPQFGLKREERKENIKGAFAIKETSSSFPLHWREKGRGEGEPSAFLVDDLLTTGTTLLEAAYILKRNGFKKVWGICLARDE